MSQKPRETHETENENISITDPAESPENVDVTASRSGYLASHPGTKELNQHGTEAARHLITRAYSENPQARAYLEEFYADLITERNIRGDEAQSENIKKAAEIMHRLFQNPPYSILCIDGRVNPTLMFGITAGMKGSSIEIPAGDPEEFIPHENGALFLNPDSNTARQLNRAYEKNDAIDEILDSHTTCAARKQSESELGNPIDDDGLRADVIRKKQIAAALQQYTQSKHPNKKIDPIQLSFDVHNGYLYMGLETKDNLAASEGTGYTEEMLHQLTAQGHIISTESLTEEPEIKALFESASCSFDTKPDWKDHYGETALQFWHAVDKMKNTVLPIIIEKMTAGPYSDILADPDKLHERAMLLLANAFAGFCNNKDRPYEFGAHQENFVSITERDFHPNNNMGFSVYSLDTRHLSERTVFAAGIVRSVREHGTNKSSHYPSQSEFKAGPVPILVKEIIHEEIADEKIWDNMRTIDWSFLEEADWMEMDDKDFIGLLHRNNPQIQLSWKMATALNNLRQRMAILYDRRSKSAPQLMSGKLFALPVIADKYRHLQIVIPFYRKGFKQPA